jgi:M6 family metalloprotease-like protein
MSHGDSKAKRWLGVIAATGLALSTLALPAQAAQGPAVPPKPALGSSPELQPIDPQQVVNLDTLTWDDFKPVPGTNWADPNLQPTIKKWKAALVLVDYVDVPFAVTQPQASTVWGTPGPLAHDIPRDDVAQFYADLLNKPNALNNGHTLNEYWMENTGGRYGVEVVAYGPYRMPKKSYQYFYSSYGNTGPTETRCPASLACNGNIRTDALAAWSGATGQKTSNFDNVFYLGAGMDQSSTWLEFGQMLFKTKEDIPDAFGPPQEWKDAVKAATGKDAPNWSPTRYVPWTSWQAAASMWPNASGNTSIEAESSGRGVYAHEFSHNQSILDNYGNPYADNPRRDFSGVWDMMSRGSFNGPGGPHQRWSVPSVVGSQMGSLHMVRDKAKLGWVDPNSVVQVNRDNLKNQGVAVVRGVQARAVQEPGATMGVNVVLGTTAAGDLSNGSCKTTDLPDGWKCDGGSYNNYTIEVVDRMGQDSYTSDSGVLLAKTKNSDSSPFHWVIDAHPEDIDLIDYYMADGTPVKLTRGDHRQLNDALFHAGTDSGSLNEYVDTYNKLHFYIINKHRDARGVLTYDVAVRNTDGAGPNARGVAVAAPSKRTVQQFAVGACTFPVTNTGEAGANPANPGLVDSDVYRLSAETSAAGWSTWLPNDLAAIKAGETANLPVYVKRDAKGAGSAEVTFTATSESDKTKTATVKCTVNADDLATPAGGAAPGTAYQVLEADVTGGPLSLETSGDGLISFGQVKLNGRDQVVNRDMHSVTVLDARGTGAGWSLTGQASDLVGSTGGAILADNVGWQTFAQVVTGGLPAPAGQAPQVTPGPEASPGSGLGNAKSLCSAGTGHSSGAFTCGGMVYLGVPGSTPVGQYTGLLTLTLV